MFKKKRKEASKIRVVSKAYHRHYLFVLFLIILPLALVFIDNRMLGIGIWSGIIIIFELLVAEVLGQKPFEVVLCIIKRIITFNHEKLIVEEVKEDTESTGKPNIDNNINTGINIEENYSSYNAYMDTSYKTK